MTTETSEKEIISGGLIPMEMLLKDLGGAIKIYKSGDSVDAVVEKVSKNKVFVIIDNRINGIVGGKELLYDPQFVKGLKKGDKITAFVLYPEDDDGTMLLSLRRAGRDSIWSGLAKKYEDKEKISVVVTDANKGGLIIEMGGVKGFLPVSQLSAEHYPRVEGGNKDEILTRLNALVGKPIDVKIMALDKPSSKLIFSEREAIGNRDIPDTINIGDQVEGKVTGIVDFGFFVDVKGVEGLVHISEISWAKVDDINDFVKTGDKLKLKIIDIENSRLSLSMKRLQEDPWKNMVKELKVGDKVMGSVARLTPYGAFVKLSLGEGNIVDALVHISEISSKRLADPSEILKLGEEKQFKILSIEPDQHRLSLSLKALEPGANKSSKKETIEAMMAEEAVAKTSKQLSKKAIKQEEKTEESVTVPEEESLEEKPVKAKKGKAEKKEKPAKEAKAKKVAKKK
ncbi:S1 RNA-binding domain-containing protein [Candidatus Microgenomates bacterium]|nr:S1 RNA-binding domain-containing protein [Candidatus Microgenomates bacterium]